MIDRRDLPWRSLRAAARATVKRKLDLTIEGAEHMPTRGPAIIAAHHHHHLYDGCALVATIPRPIHILVALDWIKNPALGFGMERACRAARWPVVLRTDGPSPPSQQEAKAALRRATRETLELLREGRIVVVFPEAYPNIDPGWTPKSAETPFLPFHPGAIRFAAMAARAGLDVPVIPAGFTYEPGPRWRVALRFGPPLAIGRNEAAALADLEAQVRRLSA